MDILQDDTTLLYNESMNTIYTETENLKQEILVRLIRAFFTENFEENVRMIPFDMRPKGYEVALRCCVYKERAVLKSRTLASLGIAIESDDERTLLSTYAKQAIQREKPDTEPLTVLQSACQGCVPSRTYVTDLCQNCVARPCVNTCKFDAIEINNGKAVIDPHKCKNCNVCVPACPFQAITKIIVPCENVCPVDAIAKDESGFAKIDFDKCIYCGKCVNICPFGAVHEKSQIIDILRKMKGGKKVIAMVAPAFMGQFSATPQQLHTALKEAGFSEAYEVAQGADITAINEAKDFEERLDAEAEFMTTSCCASYNELVEKHIPEIKPFVSHTKTPLYYTAELVKKENPDAITVFLSPCVAKRSEGMQNPDVDFVLNFQEVNALFTALNIDIENCKPTEFKNKASKEGRNFPLTSGVINAVKASVHGNSDEIYPVIINGLHKKSIQELKKYAKEGYCEQGNLIEIMSCEGGCIGGNATVSPIKNAFKQVTQYCDSSESIKDFNAN